MDRIAKAGNSGPKVRSDCEITLELRDSGGVTIDLKSKVKALYGDSILSQCRQILEYFSIGNALVTITDSGALPFVISARMEAVIKKLTGSTKDFLPEQVNDTDFSTAKDRFRFSRLYLPGNNPSLMINAGLHSADGLIFDLEDSVAPDRKYEARLLVRNALRQIDFCGSERMVRINQGDTGLEDLKVVIPQNVNLILLPKCENGDQVKRVDKEIESLRKKYKLKNPVWLMPILESAAGIENSYEIATSSENVVAMAIGLEDYTADIGVQRTRLGHESLYARTRLVNAAKAARIQPIDSVFSDVSDMEGLRANVSESRSLGFEGMGCIHPRQVPVIKEGFTPSDQEIEKAKKIVLAFEDAARQGLGVVALGSKMIDKPVVDRAIKMLDLAGKIGVLDSNWRTIMQSDENKTNL